MTGLTPEARARLEEPADRLEVGSDASLSFPNAEGGAGAAVSPSTPQGERGSLRQAYEMWRSYVDLDPKLDAICWEACRVARVAPTLPVDVAGLVEIARSPAMKEARKRLEKPLKDYWPVGDVGMVFNALEALAAALEAGARRPGEYTDQQVDQALAAFKAELPDVADALEWKRAQRKGMRVVLALFGALDNAVG